MKFKHKSMINLKNLNKYRSRFLKNFEIKNLFVIYKLKIKSHRNDELQLFICNPKLKIPQES